MKLLIYVPVQSGSTRGNRITADRWAKIITGLGHNVTIVDEFDLDPATANSFDVLVALHARKSAAVICEFKRLTSSKPVVVAKKPRQLIADGSNFGCNLFHNQRAHPSAISS